MGLDPWPVGVTELTRNDAAHQTNSGALPKTENLFCQASLHHTLNVPTDFPVSVVSTRQIDASVHVVDSCSGFIPEVSNAETYFGLNCIGNSIADTSFVPSNQQIGDPSLQSWNLVGPNISQGLAPGLPATDWSPQGMMPDTNLDWPAMVPPTVNSQFIGSVPTMGFTTIPRSNLPRPRTNCPWLGCTETFARNTDIQRHVDSVHLGIKYDCVQPGCLNNRGKGYCRLEKLRTHLRKKHGFP